MVRITYFHPKKKVTKRYKNKRNLLNLKILFQSDNFFYGYFIFFIWHTNFKDCFKNTHLKITDGMKEATINLVYSKFLKKGKSFKNWTFSDRVTMNKKLFSLNFLKFPIEKNFTSKQLLEFIFIKKRPKV